MIRIDDNDYLRLDYTSALLLIRYVASAMIYPNSNHLKAAIYYLIYLELHLLKKSKGIQFYCFPIILGL